MQFLRGAWFAVFRHLFLCVEVHNIPNTIESHITMCHHVQYWYCAMSHSVLQLAIIICCSTYQRPIVLPGVLPFHRVSSTSTCNATSIRSTVSLCNLYYHLNVLCSWCNSLTKITMRKSIDWPSPLASYYLTNFFFGQVPKLINAMVRLGLYESLFGLNM